MIAPEEVQVAEDLIFDRRSEGYDPLQRMLAIFADRKAADATKKVRARKPWKAACATASSMATARGWSDELARRMQTHAPLDIINNISSKA